MLRRRSRTQAQGTRFHLSKSEHLRVQFQTSLVDISNGNSDAEWDSLTLGARNHERVLFALGDVDRCRELEFVPGQTVLAVALAGDIDRHREKQLRFLKERRDAGSFLGD